MNENMQELQVGAVYEHGGNMFVVASVTLKDAVVVNQKNGKVFSHCFPVTVKNMYDATIVVDTEEVENEIGVSQEKTLRVVRHVRPTDIFYKELYGFTLVFDLNYTTRKIDVGISVCNGDRFNRKIGFELATSGRNYVKNLDMPDSIFYGESARGLVSWFIEDSTHENMDNDCAEYQVAFSTIETMIDMYFSSKNFLNNLGLE